jgi:CheY-like chemotaxis protein
VVISKKAVLALALEEGLPPIMADRTQLQQIAMNLLTNASEALTDEAGLIQVTTTAEELSAERLANIYDAPHLSPGTYVVLEVSDDGCGMSEDVLEKLFEPFFTTKAQGRGLGMSATLGIIRSHKGAMRVDSKPGRGTTFTLLFPASSEQPLPVEDEPSGGRWEGSGLALIVDDEEPVRAVVTRMLRRLGFDTITANDGEEAQRVLDEHADEVRLVLLDMTMPVMGGKEALAELRARYPELPVVMSSGFNEQAALPGRAADDTTYFLQKPYQLPDLERVLRRALGPSATGG